MLCKNCGAENIEQAIFCNKCGLLIDKSESGTQVYDKRSFVSVEQAKIKGKLIAVLISLAVVILLILGGLLGYDYLYGENEYDVVAREYAVSVVEGNFNKAYDYYLALDGKRLTEDVWEGMLNTYGKSKWELYDTVSEQWGVTIEDIDDILRYTRKSTKEKLRKDYGDYEISAKVLDSQEKSIDHLQKYVDELDTERLNINIDDYIDIDKIQEVYDIKIELNIEGTKDSVTETKKVFVIKYKEKYSVFSLETPHF